MDANKLTKVLAEHKLWLAVEEGCRADLEDADLRYTYLQGADLRYANLRGADLRHADLQGANLRGANLYGTDMRGANLRGANLYGADLQWANLQGANLDYSCLPLWCGSRGMIVDRRFAAQIAAHFCALDCDDEDVKAAQAALLSFALTSHRAKELLGELQDDEEVE